MRQETRLLGKMAALMGAVLVLAALAPSAPADTGWDAAPRIERGTYMAVRKVTGSSVAGTEFFPASTKRPDGICFNNSANTVWIGTVSATQRGAAGFLHDNITQGIPWVASQTFKLDGSFTGNFYFTCDATIAACELRCLDGLVN